MKNRFKRIGYLFLALLLVLNVGCTIFNTKKKTELPVNEKRVEENVENKEQSNKKIKEVSKENSSDKKVEKDSSNSGDKSEKGSNIKKGKFYYEVEDVAEYIHLYKELPPNYITKQEAKKMGWSVGDGSEYVIGGNKFGNREGLLPDEKGRQYYEADISAGYKKNRGPLRLVFSNDGLIFYTEDHYKSFKQLY